MRIAGESGYYELSLVDLGGHPKGRTFYVPSVTHILKALPKDGLDWWGYKLGISAAMQLQANGGIPPQLEAAYEKAKKLGRGDSPKVPTPRNQLTKAGAKGTDIHDVAEELFRTGGMPPKASVPGEQLPYLEALWEFFKFLQTLSVEVIALEEPLVSVKHWYAGTVDLIIKQELDTGAPLYHIIDFKTSKGIYEGHLLQVAAYDQAAREQGYIPDGAFSVKSVVRLGQDGAYELKNSECSIEQFLAVYEMWKVLQAMKGEKGASVGRTAGVG